MFLRKFVFILIDHFENLFLASYVNSIPKQYSLKELRKYTGETITNLFLHGFLKTIALPAYYFFFVMGIAGIIIVEHGTGFLLEELLFFLAAMLILYFMPSLIQRSELLYVEENAFVYENGKINFDSITKIIVKKHLFIESIKYMKIYYSENEMVKSKVAWLPFQKGLNEKEKIIMHVFNKKVRD